MKQEEDEMEGSQTAGRKRRRQEANPSRSARSNVTETPASVCRQPCVSMVIRAERKEGVALRNTGAGLKEGKAGLTRCFSVRAAVVGPAVLWGRDPKNGPMTAKEMMTETEDKVRNITELRTSYIPSCTCINWSPACRSWSWYSQTCRHVGFLFSSPERSTDLLLLTHR